MVVEDRYYFKDAEGKMRTLDWQPDQTWPGSESSKKNTYHKAYERSSSKDKAPYKGRDLWYESSNQYRTRKNPSLSQGSKIQELFLNYCRKNRVLVEINYSPQKSLQGYILGFDQEAIILQVEKRQHLLYKTGLLSVLPLEKEHSQILSDDPVVDLYAKRQ